VSTQTTELDVLRDKVARVRERLDAATDGSFTAAHRTAEQDQDFLAARRDEMGGERGSSIHTGNPDNPIWGSCWPHRNATADAEFFAHAPVDMECLLIAVELVLAQRHEDYCCLGGGCPGYGLASCDQATSPGYVCDGYRCTCFMSGSILAVSNAFGGQP
jgi:hypothetical protein